MTDSGPTAQDKLDKTKKLIEEARACAIAWEERSDWTVSILDRLVAALEAAILDQEAAPDPEPEWEYALRWDGDRLSSDRWDSPESMPTREPGTCVEVVRRRPLRPATHWEPVPAPDPEVAR